MAFIDDFWRYCSCYEITRNNAIWSAFSVLGVAVNRKVYTYIGDIYIPCNLYTLLVSDPGSGKSSARDFAVKLHHAACSEIQLAASKQSHGDIIKQMASGDCTIQYLDEQKRAQEASVYALYIDEFKNFLAYDAFGMLAFLTEIYGKDDKFDAGTLARGKEVIPFPSLTMLACENPDIMVRYIKTSMISGGFGRRVNIVYETQDADPKPRIVIPPAIKVFYDRENEQSSSLVQDLQRIKTVVGEYSHTKESQDFYDKWYVQTRKEMLGINEPVFRGWKRSSHIQLLKLAMLYDVSSTSTPSFKFSSDLLEICAAILKSIEPNMPKLFAAGGRNELALPQQQIIALIQQNGGSMSRREVEKITSKDLNSAEQYSVLGFLCKTGQLFAGKETKGGITKEYLYTEDEFRKAVKEGRIKVNQ